MPDDEQEPTPKLLTTVPGSAEATMIIGELEAAGIRAMQRPGGRGGGLWGTPTTSDIYVYEQDLDRAAEILGAQAPSEDELVQAEEEAAATQLSQPKKGEPIEIPVPKREDIEGLIDRAALSGSPVLDDSDNDRHGSEDH